LAIAVRRVAAIGRSVRAGAEARCAGRIHLVEEAADRGGTWYRRQHRGIRSVGVLVIVGVVLVIAWSFWVRLHCSGSSPSAAKWM